MLRRCSAPRVSVSLNPRAHYAPTVRILSLKIALFASPSLVWFFGKQTLTSIILQRTVQAPRMRVATATGPAKIRPLGDRVLVKKAKAEEKTAGGIILPESAQENKLHRGTVLAVGTGHRQKDGTIVPLSVKVGDQVVLNEYGGTEVKLEGEAYMLYREDDILGILEEEASKASANANKKAK